MPFKHSNAQRDITNYNKVPLRLIAIGSSSLCICLLVAIGLFVAKLVFWGSFELDIAPC